MKSGKGLGCVVNPLVGTGLSEPEKVDKTKTFAIVGGGLAGMEAAVILTTRGHKVVLYEKNQLGGQWNLAWLPPKKESLKELSDYFINELNELKIEVRFEEATKDTLLKGKYDGIIMATGALPAVPPIIGLKDHYWTEFLEDDQLPKDSKVLIIGGGLIGMEVASKLVDQNNEVIIVEMLEDVARGMEMIERALTLKKLKERNTQIITKNKVKEVDGDKVILESKSGTTVLRGVDKIVVATGMKPYHPFEIENKKVPVYFVGDSLKVGKAQEAIREAYELACRL